MTPASGISTSVIHEVLGGRPASGGQQGRRLGAEPPAVLVASSRARHQSQQLWDNRQRQENHAEFLFPLWSPGTLEPHTCSALAAVACPQTHSQQTMRTWGSCFLIH